MAMIEINDLGKSFGAAEVLKGVSFTVERGEVVVVLGPSGSGKSTLLRCINLLEDYQAGDIRIDGETIGYRTDGGRRLAWPESKNAKVREQVGLVFQSFNLFPHRTALENVLLAGAAECLGSALVRGRERLVDEAADIFLHFL